MFPPLTRYLKSNKRTLSLLDQQQWLTMFQIKQIQSHLITSGTITDPFVSAKLISFCAISNNGDLNYAFQIFKHLPTTSTFIWNTMIRAYAERNNPIQASLLYKEMLGHGVVPNNYTFSFVLRACSEIRDVRFGRSVHDHIVKLGWEGYDFVQNGLIHLYVNCDSVVCARKLFDASLNLDVISWTAMVNGYMKNGEIEVAKKLFDEMPERNAVSWGAMITGYVQGGMFKEALEIFNDMQVGGVRPNQASIVGALSACGFLGTLDQGRWIHAYVDRNRMQVDRVLGTALIDMYAKCGCIDTALEVFNGMQERDVFAFTSMISGLANHGQSEASVKLFLRMREEGVKPNEVTFICVLSACSRMGMVDEGRDIFESMSRDYGIEQQIQHYGCLVDLLGRAGMMEEAKRVVREMPLEPDSYVLGALLNACKMHGAVDLGKETVENLVQRSLDHGGVHVLLSNMYASENRWEDVAKVRKQMEDKNVRKIPGCSFIEVDGVIREFVAGDKSHFLMDEIMLLLLLMNKQLKAVGSDDDIIIELTPS
ncbi:hypothetical protein ACHQM5_000316 [Ranunculus cassubicifolius]